MGPGLDLFSGLGIAFIIYTEFVTTTGSRLFFIAFYPPNSDFKVSNANEGKERGTNRPDGKQHLECRCRGR